VYNLEIRRITPEERIIKKANQVVREEEIQEWINNEKDPKKVLFDPQDNIDNPDVPEITEAGYQYCKNRYYVARDFFDKDHIEWTHHMFKFMEHRKKYFREKNIITDNFDDKGEFLDNWVSKGMPFPEYGETILMMYQKRIEELFGFRLVPTYSYGRTYERHSRLLCHTDRPSCEVSATFPISFNTDDNKPWNIWVRGDNDYCHLSGHHDMVWDSTMGMPFERRDDSCKSIKLYPGDAMFYQGPNVIHWRERLVGNSARQIFIHYLHQDGPIFRDWPQLAYDGRPSIYHGTGQGNDKLREKANSFIQNSRTKIYPYYANAALTDPITCNPIGKGFEKYE